jgi:DNA-binding LacI/PurR family transcriptional regulator/biotin operon repressor
MPKLIIHSATEQVTTFLKKELFNGAWRGVMPGSDKLASQLGVGRDTVEMALRNLEAEGILVNQGPRRGRLITLPPDVSSERQMRVGIFTYEMVDRRLDYIMKLEHQLSEAGHRLVYPKKCLLELGMDTERVMRMVEETEVDAWIILGGSRNILKKFIELKIPAIAMFGRWKGLSVAAVGPSKSEPIAKATKRLIDLGHRRIVLITRKMRRTPKPGAPEQAFLDTLEANGILPGSYNLPDWEETIDGLYDRLESLFQITPPTAMIIDEVPHFIATRQFLARKQLIIPEDISLICTDYTDAFDWCRPKISHIKWDADPVVSRTVSWVNNVSSGKADVKHTHTLAEFDEGGTVGPVRSE